MREVAGADALAHFEQLVEVGLGALASHDAAEDALEPGTTFTARHALAATLVGVEAGERERSRRDVGGVVHHHDGARTEHRTGGAHLTTFEGQIELIGKEPRCRTTTGHERLQFVAVANATAELVAVQEIAERRGAVDDFVHARAVHMARYGHHAGAR